MRKKNLFFPNFLTYFIIVIHLSCKNDKKMKNSESMGVRGWEYIHTFPYLAQMSAIFAVLGSISNQSQN